MIELPRAALTADEIGASAEFISFGTNDLTQTALGLSRDDSGRFLPGYADMGIVKANPFESIAESGVGALVEMGVLRARSANPTIKVGVCGEHGGDPDSIGFFAKLDMDYVSCSPYRVPIARLSAAHAALAKNTLATTSA
jgi:pyruvate,orthophosphate dikinase